MKEVPAADDDRQASRLASMRVVIADPPAYTPPYDYALAGALARLGVDVRLLTSPFRYGAVPEAAGLRGRRGPLPAFGPDAVEVRPPRREGPRASASRLPGSGSPTATCSTCSGSRRRRRTRWLLHTRSPLVFTAHDLLPRRTAGRARAWKRLFARFDRVVDPQRARPRNARAVRRAGGRSCG